MLRPYRSDIDRIFRQLLKAVWPSQILWTRSKERIFTMNVSPRLRRIATLILVLLVALLLSSQAVAQDEQVLVIGHAESTDSLDPARGYTQTKDVIVRATYETLVTFPDQDASSIEPMLASSWAVADDGLTYTLQPARGRDLR